MIFKYFSLHVAFIGPFSRQTHTVIVIGVSYSLIIVLTMDHIHSDMLSESVSPMSASLCLIASPSESAGLMGGW